MPRRNTITGRDLDIERGASGRCCHAVSISRTGIPSIAMIVGQSVRSGSRIWSITPSSMPATRLTSASETGRLGSRSEITFGLHPRRVLAFGSRAALPWRVEVARVLRRGRLRSSALSSVMPQDSDRTADPLSNLSYCDRIGTPVNLRCPPQSAKGRFAAQTKGIRRPEP